MVKDIFESTIAQIEAKRQREIEATRQRVMQELVIPFNREIDVSLRDAIMELQEETNAQIAKIQEAFAEKKRVLEKSAIDKKMSFEKNEIEKAITEINYTADKSILHLRKFIGEQGE